MPIVSDNLAKRRILRSIVLLWFVLCVVGLSLIHSARSRTENGLRLTERVLNYTHVETPSSPRLMGYTEFTVGMNYEFMAALQIHPRAATEVISNLRRNHYECSERDRLGIIDETTKQHKHSWWKPESSKKFFAASNRDDSMITWVLIDLGNPKQATMYVHFSANR